MPCLGLLSPLDAGSGACSCVAVREAERIVTVILQSWKSDFILGHENIVAYCTVSGLLDGTLRLTRFLGGHLKSTMLEINCFRIACVKSTGVFAPRVLAQSSRCKNPHKGAGPISISMAVIPVLFSYLQVRGRVPLGCFFLFNAEPQSGDLPPSSTI